jgi:hypothetical protein
MKLKSRHFDITLALLALISVSSVVGWATYKIGYNRGYQKTIALELADNFPESTLCKDFKIYYKDHNNIQIHPEESDYLEKRKGDVIGIGMDFIDDPYSLKDCIYWIIFKSRT